MKRGEEDEEGPKDIENGECGERGEEEVEEGAEKGWRRVTEEETIAIGRSERTDETRTLPHANFRGKRKKKKKKKRKNTSAHLHANHMSIRVDCVTHTIIFLRTRFGSDAENVTQDRRNKK